MSGFSGFNEKLPFAAHLTISPGRSCSVPKSSRCSQVSSGRVQTLGQILPVALSGLRPQACMFDPLYYALAHAFCTTTSHTTRSIWQEPANNITNGATNFQQAIQDNMPSNQHSATMATRARKELWKFGNSIRVNWPTSIPKKHLQKHAGSITTFAFENAYSNACWEGLEVLGPCDIVRILIWAWTRLIRPEFATRQKRLGEATRKLQCPDHGLGTGRSTQASFTACWA